MLDKTLADSAVLSDRPAGSPAYDALSDKELLASFVRGREEAAFASLVRRHGPMVLSVCRRVLHNRHDAEDAFQATFLVLVEKAPRLRRPELLANWLYGVAYRTALHARQRAARRSEREREATAMSTPSSEPEIEAQELRRILDEELHRLPEKYRAPLVLCYMEGKTNEEAARVLGWPSGSMSYRLARGRDMLRQRLEARLAASMSHCLARGRDLIRQGLEARLMALPIVLSATWLTEHLQPAVVSPLLATTTVQVALIAAGAKIAAAGSAVISASVRELAEATLRSMAPSRWRWLLVGFLMLVILFGIGAAVSIASGSRASSGSHRCGSTP
jgi:RNA polymerase sigma factor (sigma-70 family)